MTEQIIVTTHQELQTLIQDAVSVAVQKLPFSQKIDNQSPEYLNIQECASMLNLAVPTLYAMVNRSEIPYIKKTKRLYFRKDILIDWLNNGRKLTKSEMLENLNKPKQVN